MKRTSTLLGRSAPTSCTSRSWMARRSLTCRVSGISAISSRKSVPPLGALDEPALGVLGAGEGPLDVAEEFALEEAFRDRAAVDPDEGAPRPAAVTVDDAGDDFLARAGLAQKADRGVGLGDTGDLIQQDLHLGTSGDDVLQAVELFHQL